MLHKVMYKKIPDLNDLCKRWFTPLGGMGEWFVTLYS